MSAVYAFTAVLETNGGLGPFQKDTPVVFNEVITNVGQVYDSSTGVFTAPVPGYYCFSFSYHADKKEPSGLMLMKNKDVTVTALDKNKPGIRYVDHASITVFLELEKDDKVYAVLPDQCHVLGSHRSTSFTGFLLTRKMCDYASVSEGTP